MDDEQLIEHVGQHEELYDMASKRYTDNVHKDGLWRKIGRELNKTGPECKNRWVSLRDQLRKAINKRKKREQAGECTKMWKYEENMAFLIPFLKERDPQSRISAAEYLYVSDEESMSKIDEVYVSMDDGEATEDCSEGDGQNDLKRRKTVNSPLAVPSENSSSIPISSYPRLNKGHTCETALTALKKFLIGSNGKEASEAAVSSGAATVHPVDAFFNGLAATVKQFSSYNQNLAESRLFKIVSDLELSHLQNQPLNFPTSQHIKENQVKEEPASQTENCTQDEDVFSLTGLCGTASIAVADEKKDTPPVTQSKVNTAKRKFEDDFKIEAQVPNRSVFKKIVERKEDIFAKFVASELKQIHDNKIYNETKWKIQVALMDGINKQNEAPSGSS